MESNSIKSLVQKFHKGSKTTWDKFVKLTLDTQTTMVSTAEALKTMLEIAAEFSAKSLKAYTGVSRGGFVAISNLTRRSRLF